MSDLHFCFGQLCCLGDKIFYFANLIFAFEAGGVEYLFPCDGCIGIDLSASVLCQQLFGRRGLL